ncbi:MAG: fumarylacetoacetate hydrolase family protein [Candidatus Dormibacteraceae bacterium]
MKLVTYRNGAEPRIGVIREDRVVDLGDLAPDLVSLIEGGQSALTRVGQAAESTTRKSHALAAVRLLAPLKPRGNVLAVGLNYRKHAEESARARSEEVGPPTVFTKAITSLIGPTDDIVANDAISTNLDWEAELGVVIGRAGANISRASAYDHVFGYTVINDVSARDVQHTWGGQWFKGKSLDGTSPVGPWVVTVDEIDDPQSLRITLRVNGKTKQEGWTGDMIRPVDNLIEWLSFGMTLQGGALIATGTPEGVGNSRTPPEYLRPGDLMETEIDGIGSLTNRIVSPPSQKRP